MKILILHATAGAGHKRAAEALEKAFRAVTPANEICVRDILDFTSPLFRRSYGEGYLDLVRRAPELYGYMYNLSDEKSRKPLEQKVRAAFNKLSARPFLKFVKETSPDIVVCTHFMPLEMVSTLLSKKKLKTRLFCSVTDCAVHSLWMVRHVERFYVATEEARRSLIRFGQPEDRILQAGIPIDPIFSQSLTPAAARTKLNLESDRPCILIVGGGFGVGPTVEMIEAFAKEPGNAQLLVVCGKNEDMKKRAEAAAKHLKQPCRVFGFVTNIHELMDASDLLVSKPGGLTSSEAMAKGLPMAIVDPIPGQEQRNCEYLLEEGAAIRIHEIPDAPYKINRLLADTKRLASMKAATRRISFPHAATTIAKDIAGN